MRHGPDWFLKLALGDQWDEFVAWRDRKKKPRPKPQKPKPPKHRPPKPPAPPPPAKVPPSSWFLPGPIVLNASEPDGCINQATGLPHKGIGSIGSIVVPGGAPVWRVVPVVGGGLGWVAQIEGGEQIQGAVDFLSRVPVSDSRAVVSTLNTPAAPLLELGVTVCFYELNAQSGWEPYGNAARLEFQAHQDGWPHAFPSYGVYVPVPLAAYGAYVPMVWDGAANGFVRGTMPQGFGPEPWMIYSADGMGDTGSWPTLAAL